MFFRKEYAFLSNMYPAPLKINGLYFSCSEAAYQSFKTTDKELRKQFQFISGPTAKKLGRKLQIRPDWDDIKLEVMEAVVRCKFNRHPELMKKLCEIKEPIREDNTWNDTYWGVCNNRGQNMLGIILMKIRDETDEDIPF